MAPHHLTQQSPPCPETQQSPPQVCLASGLPKGVRERTSPEKWQQERRNAGLGREGQCLLGLDCRGHPLVLRSPERAGCARGPTLGQAAALWHTQLRPARPTALPSWVRSPTRALRVHDPVWRLEGKSPKGMSGAKVRRAWHPRTRN